MKLVQACLSVRKDLESGFHHCGGPVKHVQSCVSAGKVRQKPFKPPWRLYVARSSLFMRQERSRKRFALLLLVQ